MDGKFLVMVTKDGIIKRCDATEFSKIRATGIRALTLKEGDELVFCSLSNGSDNIVIATANGQGIRFKEDEVRSMGRQAAGVIGIRLRKTDSVVGMEVVSSGKDVLFATELGYGKKVHVDDFRLAHRGGVGVRTIPTDKRNGKVIGLVLVQHDSNVLLIDYAGKIIRLPSDEIRTMGRQAKGVRLIRLDEGQKLATMVSFIEPEAIITADTIVDGAGQLDEPIVPSQRADRFDSFEDEFIL
jgi:DNA gyrase subunit A